MAQIFLNTCVGLCLVGSLIGEMASASGAVEPSLVWETEAMFLEPESAVIDADSGNIYVSNVNTYAKDGNGFISRISGDGQNIDLKWLVGLNSPTGLAISDGRLYAVDYDALVVVDIESATILHRFAAPEPKPALNDVVISEHGVFVSGSLSNTIYQLRDSELVAWHRDDDLLTFVNGLFVQADTLVVGGQQLFLLDLKTRKQIPSAISSDERVTDIDGIAEDACGQLIISLLDDERLWHVDLDNELAKPLSDRPVRGIDLSHDAGQLAIPIVGGKVAKYQMPEAQCDKP